MSTDYSSPEHKGASFDNQKPAPRQDKPRERMPVNALLAAAQLELDALRAMLGMLMPTKHPETDNTHRPPPQEGDA